MKTHYTFNLFTSFPLITNCEIYPKFHYIPHQIIDNFLKPFAMVFFLKPGKTRNSNFRSYQIRLTCLSTLINPPILDTRSTDPLHTRSLPPPSPLLSPCVIIRRLHWCRFHAVINNGARNGIEEACPRKNNEKRKEKEKERGGIRNKGAEAGPFERIRSDRPFVTVRARVSVPFRESFHPWPSRISRNKSTGDRSCAEDYSLAAKGAGGRVLVNSRLVFSSLDRSSFCGRGWFFLYSIGFWNIWIFIQYIVLDRTVMLK